MGWLDNPIPNLLLVYSHFFRKSKKASTKLSTSIPNRITKPSESSGLPTHTQIHLKKEKFYWPAKRSPKNFILLKIWVLIKASNVCFLMFEIALQNFCRFPAIPEIKHLKPDDSWNQNEK